MRITLMKKLMDDSLIDNVIYIYIYIYIDKFTTINDIIRINSIKNIKYNIISKSYTWLYIRMDAFKTFSTCMSLYNKSNCINKYVDRIRNLKLSSYCRIKRRS